MKRSTVFIVFAVLGVITAPPACADVGFDRAIVLRGTILTPGGVIKHGYVGVANGRVESVSEKQPDLPGAIDVNTEGIILPGFVDLHNHVAWNALPRWNPGRTFTNRNQWAADAEFHRVVADPFDPGAGPKAPVSADDDADRHFLAGLGQRELVGRAVAQSRLFGDDRIVIERVDARLLQLNVKTPFAREQRERRGGQREPDEASKADSGHRERARRPASRNNSTIRGGEGYRGSGTPASRGP